MRGGGNSEVNGVKKGKDSDVVIYSSFFDSGSLKKGNRPRGWRGGEGKVPTTKLIDR